MNLGSIKIDFSNHYWLLEGLPAPQGTRMCGGGWVCMQEDFGLCIMSANPVYITC